MSVNSVPDVWSLITTSPVTVAPLGVKSLSSTCVMGLITGGVVAMMTGGVVAMITADVVTAMKAQIITLITAGVITWSLSWGKSAST